MKGSTNILFILWLVVYCMKLVRRGFATDVYAPFAALIIKHKQ